MNGRYDTLLTLSRAPACGKRRQVRTVGWLIDAEVHD